MNNQDSASTQLQDTAVSALAAASKTPFKTAFKVTFGIGMARLALFLSFMAGFMLLCRLAKGLFG